MTHHTTQTRTLTGQEKDRQHHNDPCKHQASNPQSLIVCKLKPEQLLNTDILMKE